VRRSEQRGTQKGRYRGLGVMVQQCPGLAESRAHTDVGSEEPAERVGTVGV
jgi:hypothetical protein